jgi:hypothetical protein
MEAHRIHTDRLTIDLAAMAHERRTATASIAAKYPSGTDKDFKGSDNGYELAKGTSLSP